MNQTVSKPIIIGAVVLVIALVVLIGYNSLFDKGMSNIPTPGPIKQTEGMAANPKPGNTMGSKGPKASVSH